MGVDGAVSTMNMLFRKNADYSSLIRRNPLFLTGPERATSIFSWDGPDGTNNWWGGKNWATLDNGYHSRSWTQNWRRTRIR